MDINEVWPMTYLDIHIRPAAWMEYEDPPSKKVSQIHCEMRVDNWTTGRGTGKTIGEAIVAMGLDMMGVESDLLVFTMDQLRKIRELENK